MPKVLSFSDGFYIESYDFAQPQVAANQSAVAIPITATDATSGTLLVTGYVMPWAGSIIAVAAEVSTASSAGTGSVSVTKGGTADAASALTVTALTSATTKFDGQSVVRFAAGDIIGVKVTTSAAWNATTSDIHVKVYVLFEGVQP